MLCTLIVPLAFLLLNGQAKGEEKASVPVTLVTALDAKQAKVGDPATARVGETSGGFQKGAKIAGHVVSVKRSSGNHAASELTIIFDRYVAGTGSGKPLSAEIASIARTQGTAAPTATGSSDMGIPATPGGEAMHGQSSGPTNNAPPRGADAKSTPSRAAEEFTIEQHPDGTAIGSKSGDVRLDAGTQLLLRINEKH